MALGDVGGSITEMVITCRTPATGDVDIAAGDAVALAGPYTVDNQMNDEDAVLGQALADETRNGALLPVRIRGVCVFAYAGEAPTLDGVTGIVGAEGSGEVKAPASGAGRGVMLAVDTAAKRVHVLI